MFTTQPVIGRNMKPLVHTRTFADCATCLVFLNSEAVLFLIFGILGNLAKVLLEVAAAESMSVLWTVLSDT